MGKNETVSIESMKKICNALDCNIENIMEFVPEKVVEKVERPKGNFTSIELFAGAGGLALGLE